MLAHLLVHLATPLLKRTFWNIETGQKEFTVSDTTFSSSGITDDACNQVANIFNILNKLFCRYALCEGTKCSTCRFNYA